MTFSWAPVIVIDIAGSAITLLTAFWCAVLSRKWTRQKPDDIFRHYIFLLTLAIVLFAISRSFGHLAKQLLLINDMGSTWEQISPYSGTINSVTFIVIFAFSLYFHRFRRIHTRIEKYKNNLEEMIALRTGELNEANLTLENVLNSSNPLCITTVDHVILKANDAYWAIWPGITEEKLKCYISRPGPFCQTEECPLFQIKAGQKEVFREISKKIDGVTRVFIVTGRPFRDLDNNLVGVVESFQDISPQKKMELALASEREQLAVTLRSIGDGVITTDLKGNILLINKVTEHLTGWSQQEAIGQPVEHLFKIIDENSGIPSKSPVDEVLASGKIVELASNTALIARDGTQYSIEDSGAPIFNKNSEIIGTVLVFRNVTEKRRTKKELLKVQKLESVGILAGGIAHDFNNILAAILGNIELAEMFVDSENKAYPLLQTAKKASLRAKDLTLQLLTFSKGGDPVKKTTSIAKTITESTNFILHGSSLSCQFTIPDNLWLVDIDSGQIGQVIQNLVMNAQAAMAKGEKIRIIASNVEQDNPAKPHHLSDKAYIKIAVEDDGYGISEAHLEKIFDPYFTTRAEGSGLGLAIIHSIIKKHHGHIEVHSKVDEGTIFTIYLPASKQHSPMIPTSTETTHSLETRKARILIMDDEVLVQDIAKLMLSTCGHEVLIAANGREAIDIFKEQQKNGKPVDIIIMDLTIPGGMGGKEAVIEILKTDPSAKVIVSSGYSNDPVMADYQEYGFKAALTKPFLLEELKTALRNVLVA